MFRQIENSGRLQGATMQDINSAEYQARRLVDSLFKANAARYGEICDWPVIGGHYVSGFDPIEATRETAVCALLARDGFAHNGPPDAQPLPLSCDERERLKVGGLKHLLAWYARSLACLDYAVEKHPSFDDHASDHAPDFIKENEELRRRFPAQKLIGLGPGLIWEPPALHAETMAS